MTITQEQIHHARILVVDDQDANVQLLLRLLGEAGYQRLASTTNPVQVSDLHREHDYDLILLDVQMPVMDGFEVLADLAANHVNGVLPVMVLTAQPGHKLRALQAGVRDFISKPFDLLEVTTRIRNMLEVRLLYRQLEAHNQQLERKVQERTAELRESEARFKSLTELASDWYWEQDAEGAFVKISGPVQEMLGLMEDELPDETEAERVARYALCDGCDGWNPSERSTLRAAIAARRPFLDYAFTRTKADGTTRHFRVSGEPMFATGFRFVGYRGIGVETTPRHVHMG